MALERHSLGGRYATLGSGAQSRGEIIDGQTKKTIRRAFAGDGNRAATSDQSKGDE